MTSQTDLDQGGTFRQLIRLYMGPSIGWVDTYDNAVLAVTSGGIKDVGLGTTLVMVNSIASPTIQLPSSLKSGAGAGAVPGKSVGRPITVVDAGGNGTSAPITILPFGSETIDGLASIEISHPYGAFVLTPNIDSGGWTLTQ